MASVAWPLLLVLGACLADFLLLCPPAIVLPFSASLRNIHTQPQFRHMSRLECGHRISCPGHQLLHLKLKQQVVQKLQPHSSCRFVHEALSHGEKPILHRCCALCHGYATVMCPLGYVPYPCRASETKGLKSARHGRSFFSAVLSVNLHEVDKGSGLSMVWHEFISSVYDICTGDRSVKEWPSCEYL